MDASRSPLLLLLLANCAAPTNNDAGGSNSDAAPAPMAVDARSVDAATEATNFVEPGPLAVSSSPGSLAIEGCQINYDLYTPNTSTTGPLVILGHGFSRSPAQMAGVAKHIAGFGARVATPSYCHLSAFDTDHEANGAAAAALARELASGQPLLFAGHSAGGLAAVLGARDYGDAVAVLGLDLVDAEGLALSAAGELSIPTFGILGAPSSCNSSGNGSDVFEETNSWAVRVNGATHCDFEDPSNGLCTGFCGGETNAIPTIRALAAAFVSWQLGLDATGQDWVSPGGSEYQRLVDDGTLSPL